MSLFNIFSRGKEEANQRYLQIGEDIFEKARYQSHQHKIEITSEAAEIGEMCGILRKREVQEYRDIATWLLADYEPELAYSITLELNEQFQRELEHPPLGSIMLAIERIDHIAHGGMMVMKNSKVLDLNRSPRRTEKAIETLSTALCSLRDMDYARKTYGLLIVPEMKMGVKDKLYSVDEIVAKHITK